MHVATVERKNSLLTGRNLQQNQAQCERPSAMTDWGFERTEQRHKRNTEALIQEYFLLFTNRHTFLKAHLCFFDILDWKRRNDRTKEGTHRVSESVLVYITIVYV
ncbi:hypothetical protein ATANTOWER_009561 [Ataeniobius toweri]|uniref:Uncharacterized protein n=1 Tax=Ataeniobius toweri TaxID=208326 RepID=A0ABU7BYL3_9TELE|nr:hypothetical protein [Ataeniobius toweri]